MALKKIGNVILLTILTYLYSVVVHAQEVQIRLEPERPVKESPFKMLFIVDVAVDEVPVVNFNPVGIEVLGRQLLGVAKRSSFVNGKLSSKTQYTIAYDLVANRTGMARVEDIEVITGGKKLLHKDYNFQVLGSNPIANDHFVIAIPSKREVFVGESIMLDYYIYTRTQTANHEIRKFPILKNFIKRFIQKPDVTERVEYNGRVYNRRLLYSVQLFPEKVGELKIDALSLKYQFAVVDQDSSSFGNFGFGFRSLKTTTASSDQISIKVNPIPANAPSTYIGLVGIHDIQVSVNKTKFIVNDPIELKFEITGKGALENFEAPQFIKSDSIEQFETNGDLKISLDEKATKVFEYTYLPKAPMTIPEKEIVMSFLDAETGNFVNKTLRIPALTIGGVADPGTVSSKDDKAVNSNDNNTSRSSIKSVTSEAATVSQVVGPVAQPTFFHAFNKYFFYFVILLTGFVWFMVFRQDIGRGLLKRNEVNEAIHFLKNNKNLNYAMFRRAFSFIDARIETLTFDEYLRKQKLSEQNASYLKALVDQLETVQYVTNKTTGKELKLDYKRLTEIFKEVIDHANIKQSEADFL